MRCRPGGAPNDQCPAPTMERLCCHGVQGSMRHRAQHVLLCLTLLATVPSGAQESVPQFEVATLKLSPPPTGASISINLGTFQNGRFTFGNVTLNDAVQFAFDLPSQDLLVGVDWSDSLRFDVEAIAPRDTPPARLRLMVRDLLEERLHLVTRAEQRTLRHIGVDPITWTRSERWIRCPVCPRAKVGVCT